MNRSQIKVALASIVLSAAGLAMTGGKAIADTATVNFSGTVGATCTLSNPVAGTMAVMDTNDSVLTSSSDAASAGVPGSIRVVCSGPAEITADAVSVTNSPAAYSPLATYPRGYVTFDNYGTYSEVDGNGVIVRPALTTAGAIDADLRVDLSLLNDGGVPMPDGAYAGSVTVSANPL